MAEATWEVTETDRKIAWDGVNLQFRALDIQAFLDNQVEVIAAYAAQTRFLQNKLNEGYFE